VVGAHALALYGKPRYTGDLDLWVQPALENIEKLIRALDAFGFASLGVTAADFLTPEAMIQLGYPPARIDLLTAMDGVAFDDAYVAQCEFIVTGVTLPTISVEHFIQNKRATGRTKDLAHIEALQRPAPNAS
jgi:hypothetical protein